MELAAPQQLVLNVITPVPKAQSLSNMAAQRPSEGEGAKSQKQAHGRGFSNTTHRYSLLHNYLIRTRISQHTDMNVVIQVQTVQASD